MTCIRDDATNSILTYMSSNDPKRTLGKLVRGRSIYTMPDYIHYIIILLANIFN